MYKFLNKFFGKNNIPQRYSQLYENIATIKPKNIMEIGVWSGDRGVKMIYEAAKYNPISEIKYYGFDLFEDLTDSELRSELSKRPPTMHDVEMKLSATGAKIKLIKGNTNITLSKEMSNLPLFDFIFIDGGHSYETIKNDWEQSSKVLAPSGVIVFDDYWLNREDAGCKKIVDSIDTSKYNVEILPIMDTFNNDDYGLLKIKFAKVSLIS